MAPPDGAPSDGISNARSRLRFSKRDRSRALCRVSTVTHRTFAPASRYAVIMSVGGVTFPDANALIPLRPLASNVVSRWKDGNATVTLWPSETLVA